ncbi:helix-turn-helix domain-containing protein [Tepidibacter formicigenes]|uniref:Transcriptional regulator, contains XRE-family HTH domain n=1 Tax=Tepidibacter formicigenes DSM 15518 TaxID=1123349 RepID=A0A1M6SLP3_9FIRM|nr:helix-turn-helix transcriptional regulator [Tepidibacter formicigenes]SHK45556.1 Transcriptional regulator, contains XRE-family HTH domain [Tepidibacter formicigenes DSM 15518]
MATFGERFKLLRNEKNLTQEKLANIFFLNKSSISRYEQDKQMPEIDLLQKFADFFGVSLDYLMGKSNIRNPHIPEEYTQKHKVTKNDIKQYEDFIENASAFFMNDEVADEDKEKLFRDISKLFWESKEINKKKYGRKKKKTDN